MPQKTPHLPLVPFSTPCAHSERNESLLPNIAIFPRIYTAANNPPLVTRSCSPEAGRFRSSTALRAVPDRPRLLIDEGERLGTIAESMQLIAGRTGQEFNKRKRRGGAFWEVRYHATAVDSDEYLRRCMAYIDLKMVRAGVVDHPSKWLDSGYRAIQEPP